MKGQASQTAATRGIHASQLRCGRPAACVGAPKDHPKRGAEKSGQNHVEDGCGGDAVIEKVSKHFGFNHAVHAEGEKEEAADGDSAKRGRSGEAA